MSTADCCGTCRFGKVLNPDGEGYSEDRGYSVSDFGTVLCRRYPPRGPRPDWEENLRGKGVDSMDAAMGAHWPIVFDEDWCGEFQPIAKEYLGV